MVEPADPPDAVKEPNEVRRIHALDTLSALARDVASPVAAFYRQLRDSEGLSREEAVPLAAALTRAIWDHLATPHKEASDE